LVMGRGRVRELRIKSREGGEERGGNELRHNLDTTHASERMSHRVEETAVANQVQPTEVGRWVGPGRSFPSYYFEC